MNIIHANVCRKQGNEKENVRNEVKEQTTRNPPNTNQRFSPHSQDCGFSTAFLIAASRFNTFAVATDGSVFGCGSRTTNGHNVQQTRLALIDSARLSGVNKIFTNSVSQTVYALKTNGELWAWGFNNSGQLGVAIVSPFTNANPAKINFAWPSPIKEMSVGHRSTMIMLNNNDLYALGACSGGRTGMLYYNGIPTNFIVPTKATYAFPGTVKTFAMDLNFGGGPNGVTSLFYVE